MAYRRRVRARRRGATLSGAIRRYMYAFLFLTLAFVVIGAVSYLSGVIPESNLTIGNIRISNRLFINVLAWAVGILLFISAIAKFGIRI